MRRPTTTILALLLLIAIVTLLGPREQTLGAVARIVYLHGALVWVALLTFAAAGLLGLASLLTAPLTAARHPHNPAGPPAPGRLAAALRRLPAWSRAAGRVALLFWIAYLPLSMWAARAAWGRLYLDDPSFQNAFRILAVALIAQALIWLRSRSAWLAGLLNAGVFAFLVLQLVATQKFMHPRSPIGDSNSLLIQLYFYLLTALCALLSLLLTRLLHRPDHPPPPT